MIIEKNVTDRVLILGVDYLYREFMKKYESGPLLNNARNLAARLKIPVGSCHAEGYYKESRQLCEYFNFIQSFKNVPYKRIAELKGCDDYKRIIEVLTSPIYGKYTFNESIIPGVHDPINMVMKQMDIAQWSCEKIMEEACKVVNCSENFSLTALALLINDPVVVTALREPAVLYIDGAEFIEQPGDIPAYKYNWNVSEKVQERVNLYIDTFNRLPAEKIKSASNSNAEYFYNAFKSNDFSGRCAPVGTDLSSPVTRYYHWAVGLPEGSSEYQFREFWDEKIWTSDMLRGQLGL